MQAVVTSPCCRLGHFRGRSLKLQWHQKYCKRNPPDIIDRELREYLTKVDQFRHLPDSTGTKWNVHVIQEACTVELKARVVRHTRLKWRSCLYIFDIDLLAPNPSARCHASIEASSNDADTRTTYVLP